MLTSRVTLLVEDLDALAGALPETVRLPALEFVLTRGHYRRQPVVSANHLRCELFGLEPNPEPPVAALSRIARTGNLPQDGYWLRADPVVLRADMTRVFMISSGFGDCTPDERETLGGIVRDALVAEGFGLPGDEPGPWCFTVESPPACRFTPFREALGVDMADVLPSGAGSAQWKRLLTDIQVELHQCEVNRARRERGQAEVNSAWFWGGGEAPETVAPVFDCVTSEDPVSRGLAAIAGIPCTRQNEPVPEARRWLIDWCMPSGDAQGEAAALERHIMGLLGRVRKGNTQLLLLDGTGGSWAVGRFSRFRFWNSSRPVRQLLAGGRGP